MSYEFKSTSRILKARVARLKERVAGLKALVGRLKARFEAIKLWIQNTEFHELQKVLFSLLSKYWT